MGTNLAKSTQLIDPTKKTRIKFLSILKKRPLQWVFTLDFSFKIVSIMVLLTIWDQCKNPVE